MKRIIGVLMAISLIVASVSGCAMASLNNSAATQSAEKEKTDVSQSSEPEKVILK